VLRIWLRIPSHSSSAILIYQCFLHCEVWYHSYAGQCGLYIHLSHYGFLLLEYPKSQARFPFVPKFSLKSKCLFCRDSLAFQDNMHFKTFSSVFLAITSFMVAVNAMPAVEYEIKKRDDPQTDMEAEPTTGVCFLYFISTLTACPELTDSTDLPAEKCNRVCASDHHRGETENP